MTQINYYPATDAGTIRALLYQLGWTWKNKRVQAYLKACTQLLGYPEYQKLEEAPAKVLLRLGKFLQIYKECDRILELLEINWDDTLVAGVVQQFSEDGYTMPLKGYERLYEVLENYWFIHGGGF